MVRNFSWHSVQAMFLALLRSRKRAREFQDPGSTPSSPSQTGTHYTIQKISCALPIDLFLPPSHSPPEAGGTPARVQPPLNWHHRHSVSRSIPRPPSCPEEIPWMPSTYLSRPCRS